MSIERLLCYGLVAMTVGIWSQRWWRAGWQPVFMDRLCTWLTIACLLAAWAKGY